MGTIAILGCGSIGLRHLNNLLAAGLDDIVVFDPSPRVRETPVHPGVSLLAASEEVWERQPELVLICTPPHLHTQYALVAAQHGAHLFIEKPVAHSLEDLDELAGSIRSRGLIDLIGCNMRFHPGPAQLKSWLESGVIGETLSARLHTGSYLPRWRPNQDYRASYSASPIYGGALLDCIHEIDLALWLLGDATLRAAAVRPAASLGLQTDGLAELLLEHTGGTLSSIHLNFVQRNYRRSIEVIGSEGTLFWDFNEGLAIHYGPNGQPVQQVRQPVRWQINQMYVDELAYFLRCAACAEPTFNTVANAMQPLRIALTAKAMTQ